MQQKFYKATYILGGREINEEFYVTSPQMVRNDLAHRGIIPTRVQEMKMPWWKEEVISLAYKQRFLRAIGFHVRAGMTPSKALQIVTEGEENRSVRKKLEMAQQVMTRGGMFSDAIEVLDFYPHAVVALLTAGEKTGSLPESVEMANKYMTDAKSSSKGHVASAAWFGFEFLMAVSGVVAVQYQFLPWIQAQVESSQDRADIDTLLAKVDLAFLINGGLLVVAVLFILAITGLFATLFFAKGDLKIKVANIISKLPGMKPVIYDSEFHIAFSLIAKMLSKGIPFSDAVKTCEETSKMPDITLLWRDVQERLRAGYTIAHAMDHRQFFTKAELVEMQAHQDAQQLQQVVETIAEDRKDMALQGKKHVVIAGFAISMAYSFLSALVAIWALMLQSQGINIGIQ